MLQVRSIALLGSAVLLLSSTALAHVSVSGPGIADSTQVLTFGVGHGCEGADTVAIEISIPEEVTITRGLVGPVGFGQPVITKNDADIVTKVTWTKADAEEGDDRYYQFGIRIKVPNVPWKTILFPTKQTCRTSDGEEIVADWALSPEEAAEGGEHALEAPALTIVPPRKPGWNKYSVTDKVEDLSVFDDAQIVWLGDKAYSSNPTTKSLIESDEEVDELTEIPADSEIWVKY